MLSALVLKEELKSRVSAELSESEREVAARDHHAVRPPRPCGLTIHTAIGCVFRCKYCYIYDMGFKPEVKPYPLTGIQLVYSLLSNKYFIPGSTGTYLAFGSVSEPFHPLVKDKTFEYVECVYKYLGNPVQFSTKAYLSRSDAEKLVRMSEGKISPLVTVVTLEYSDLLEPYAPKPEKRLETIRNLKEAGLKPFLFLRPIIPGLTEKEYKQVISLAKEYGAVGVVAGSLRVTKRILSELKEAGLDISEIARRLKVPLDKMKQGVQYDVIASDIKEEIEKYARKEGLVFFPAACMANLYTHSITCWKMHLMGLGKTAPPKPTPDEVRKLAERLGVQLVNVRFEGGVLSAVARCRNCNARLIGELLRSSYLACTKIFIAT